MIWIRSYFTIYIDLLMLAIGVYMAFIQSVNLEEEKMEREGRFSKTVGYIYLVLGGLGLLIFMS